MFFVALSFAAKLLPLYGNIFIGYVAGRWTQLDQRTIARFMFYLISPLVIFHATWHVPLDLNLLSLPLITFFLSSFLGLAFYGLGGWLWPSDLKNIAAFSAGSGATGFFGVPLALTLLGPSLEGRYIMAALGVTLYDNSVGYYISMRTTQNALSCLKQIAQLPSIYAFLAGILFNLFQIPDHTIYNEFIQPIRGVYFVVGMMLVGLCLSELSSFKLERMFTLITFGAKFIGWPLLAWGLILLDSHYLHWYSLCDHHILILLSFVPIAINTVVMAALNECHTDKVAATVVLSSGFAMLYIPIIASLTLPCNP
jgi:predicted permease